MAAHRALKPNPARQDVAFWRPLVRQVINQVPTPFYLFSIVPFQEALAELSVLERHVSVPVRHWLSCKTQPVQPLLQSWRRRGSGIEVVSEFELRAALSERFLPDRILVNGPAKHHWLGRHPIQGLRVNFDSLRELDALLPLAQKLRWSVGIRCHTQQEFDPDHPESPTQFGLQASEAVAALRKLQRARVRLETIHFHLRTNVASPDVYERALNDVAEICRAARFRPAYLDCGGGLPPPQIRSRQGLLYDADFRMRDLAAVYQRALLRGPFGNVKELWLENGRFLSARAGLLVVRVLDLKERPGLRHLICDGGRTTNALISCWEDHNLFSHPGRGGRQILTAVCGPTCMAFDQLKRLPLSSQLRAGDHLVWTGAGAYHIPWETHFSHGLAGVVWHDGHQLKLVRRTESFRRWWSRWEAGKKILNCRG